MSINNTDNYSITYSEHQKKQLERIRSCTVKKASLQIQKARYGLSVLEQKILCFLVSEIKETDTAFTEKIFDIKLFYEIAGVTTESYNYIKLCLQHLKQACWWLPYDNEGTESCMSFLSIARTNKGTGKVTIKFHEDMFPYLVEMQIKNDKLYATRYSLAPVLAMQSQYSIRLYELLKSYQNRGVWNFSIEELKHKFDCTNYDKVNDFKKRVIEPAIKEINKFTDIEISYNFLKQSKKFDRIEFYITPKSDASKADAEKAVVEELDGQVTFGGDADGK